MNQVRSSKLSFIFLVFGCLLSLLGALAPFWQSGHIVMSQLSLYLHDDSLADGNLTTVDGGLWWYCYSNTRVCNIYRLGEDEGAVWAVRVGTFFNVILVLFCFLVALCRCCYTGVGRNICVGIMAFIAGFLGFGVIGLFVYLATGGYGLKLEDWSYAWAFYIYIIGCSVVIIDSVLLCVAYPG
ncbi:uncharacterized protein LOC131948617 [Physella acuta]|uniref:uncharacterized protein LOC131948617 n=1 Tax=Physella acuta TaxID=109671 RepID=UPI0027DE0194|nr:uncharacterized protein LOC131948617 [Physella acuta]XP_059166205.1 uncharacterized protein LOC131948617 [Physella acuta]